MQKTLEAYLHKNIPLSKAMGISVDFASQDRVVLMATLLPNINHKKTVFGGSLHAVATLACWSILHLNLQKLSHHYQIVITKSEASFLAPVDSEFKAVCTLTHDISWERFMKQLLAKGKARIELKATIDNENELAVSYVATFAALRS